jgi:lipoate-protein ligase A
MAADLYLLDTCAHTNEITLRLYEWDPSAISLGYMQNPGELLDTQACKRDGIAWIRRITGGRAVLHKEDITYSCVFPVSLTWMGTTVAQTYALLSRCLAAGLRRCGIRCSAHDALLDAQQARREVKLPCFLASNRDEIMVEGKKLIGSAQKRTSTGVLQHGSIPMTRAFQELPFYTRIDTRQQHVQKRLLGQKCTCLCDIHPSITKQACIDALAQGFTEGLGVTARYRDWTAEEYAAIQTRAHSAAFASQWCQCR